MVIVVVVPRLVKLITKGSEIVGERCAGIWYSVRNKIN